MTASSRSRSAPLVVGAGATAEAYVAAFRQLGVEPVVLGRGRERAERLRERLGVEARWGGLEALEAAPEAAVVAVGVPELAAVAAALLARGCPRVLVEKPGALHLDELERLRDSHGDVFVGWNRRFYPSVVTARRAIEEDGGPLSLHMELTEVEERVTAVHPPGDPVLERWGVVNSAHVLDLGFHLAGRPLAWEQRRAGSLPWHPSGAVFAGSGETDRGALFSYLGTWSGAGRWVVEVSTARRKLILRPLEELHVQHKGSFELERAELDAEPAGLKPGLYGQVRAFLERDDALLCPLDEAVATWRAAARVFGYR